MTLLHLTFALAAVQSASAFGKKHDHPKNVVRMHKQVLSEIEKTKVSLQELASRDVELQSAGDRSSANLQSSGVCLYPWMIDCSSTTCASCLANHPNADYNWVWIGYCTNLTSDLLGSGWGARFGNMDCGTSITSREYSINCETASGSEFENCNSTLVSLGDKTGIGFMRTDFTLSSSATLLDFNTGAFSGTTSFYNALAGESYFFGVYQGATSYVNGPPSISQQASYVSIPQGSFAQTSFQVTASNSYVVYESGFAYTGSDYSSGVGATTTFTGVAFDDWTNATVTSLVEAGSGQNKNFTATLCTTQTSPQACLEMTIASQSFSKDGLQISSSGSKTDVYVNGVAYSGTEDSYGIRVMAISSTYTGTVSTQDTGNSASEESETFGAAYLITEKTVMSSPAQITQSNQGNAPSVSVVKQDQALSTTSGSECGFTGSDWYGQTQTGNGVTYTNAKQFFAQNNFGTMTCSFYSFQATNSTLDNFLWDPVLGIDPVAAAEAASAGGSSSSSSDNTGVIVGAVVGAVVGVGLIAGAFYLYRKRGSSRAVDKDVGAQNL